MMCIIDGTAYCCSIVTVRYKDGLTEQFNEGKTKVVVLNTNSTACISLAIKHPL